MFEFIGIAFVLWIVWKVIQAIMRTATTQAYHQGEAESLNVSQAENAYEEAESEFIGLAAMPFGSHAAEQQSMLDRAVFLRDRVNQLKGYENGAAFRAKYRLELIAKANHLAPVLSGDVETIRAREKERIFASYDSWLEEFKFRAESERDELDTGDDDRIIDDIIASMDQTLLREAYRNGADPRRLGSEFGENFDLTTFIKNNPKWAT